MTKDESDNWYSHDNIRRLEAQANSQTDKICPLLNSAIPAQNKCKGGQCAFWAWKKKYVPETKSYVNDEGYCIVRDFLLTMIAKNSY